MLPTLGVGMEEVLRADLDALYATYTSFNRWLEEEWGFAFERRVFSAPMLCLIDPHRAVVELDRVLEAGARVVHLRPGPVLDDGRHGRSLGDPVYQPFWSRLEDAGALRRVPPGRQRLRPPSGRLGRERQPDGLRGQPAEGRVRHRPRAPALRDDGRAGLPGRPQPPSRAAGGAASRRARRGSARSSTSWPPPTRSGGAHSPRTRWRCSTGKCGCRRSTRRTWPVWSTCSAPTMCSSGPTGLTPRGWPIRRPTSTISPALDPADVRAVMRDNTRRLLGLGAPS